MKNYLLFSEDLDILYQNTLGMLKIKAEEKKPGNLQQQKQKMTQKAITYLYKIKSTMKTNDSKNKNLPNLMI